MGGEPHRPYPLFAGHCPPHLCKSSWLPQPDSIRHGWMNFESHILIAVSPICLQKSSRWSQSHSQVFLLMWTLAESIHAFPLDAGQCLQTILSLLMVPLVYCTAHPGMLAPVSGAPSPQWGLRCGVTALSPTLSHTGSSGSWKACKSFKNTVSSISDLVLFPLHLHPTPHPKPTLSLPSPPLPLLAFRLPPLVGVAQNSFPTLD